MKNKTNVSLTLDTVLLSRLKDRARSTCQPLSHYISQLLEQALSDKATDQPAVISGFDIERMIAEALGKAKYSHWQAAKSLLLVLKQSSKASPVKADLIAILEAELNPEGAQLPALPLEEDEGIDPWVKDRAEAKQQQKTQLSMAIEPAQKSTLQRIPTGKKVEE